MKFPNLGNSQAVEPIMEKTMAKNKTDSLKSNEWKFILITYTLKNCIPACQLAENQGTMMT